MQVIVFVVIFIFILYFLFRNKSKSIADYIPNKESFSEENNPKKIRAELLEKIVYYDVLEDMIQTLKSIFK